VNGVAEVVDFFLGLGGARLERVADEIKLTPAAGIVKLFFSSPTGGEGEGGEGLRVGDG
jgi:hypothetical protein